MSKIRAKVPFAGGHGEREDILLGNEGADVDWIVDAVRIISNIKIKKIGSVSQIDDGRVAAAAVGVGAVGRVLEENGKPAVFKGAIDLEPEGISAPLETEATDTFHRDGGVGGGRYLDLALAAVGVQLPDDMEAEIDGIIVEMSEITALGRLKWRVVAVQEQAVLECSRLLDARHDSGDDFRH